MYKILIYLQDIASASKWQKNEKIHSCIKEV
jgi:hypothetical protein